MTKTRFSNCVSSLGVAVIASSCGWMLTYIVEPGVDIVLKPTSYGRIASAGFWSTDRDVMLRGEIVPKPVTKSPLFGHVHALVVEPGEPASNCFTTRQEMGVRQVRKPYTFHFSQLPSPGSVVTVFYHEHSSDHDCVDNSLSGQAS